MLNFMVTSNHIHSLMRDSEAFAEQVKCVLGVSARHRQVVQEQVGYSLREPSPDYSGHFGPESSHPSVENAV